MSLHILYNAPNEKIVPEPRGNAVTYSFVSEMCLPEHLLLADAVRVAENMGLKYFAVRKERCYSSLIVFNGKGYVDSVGNDSMNQTADKSLIYVSADVELSVKEAFASNQNVVIDMQKFLRDKHIFVRSTVFSDDIWDEESKSKVTYLYDKLATVTNGVDFRIRADLKLSVTPDARFNVEGNVRLMCITDSSAGEKTNHITSTSISYLLKRGKIDRVHIGKCFKYCPHVLLQGFIDSAKAIHEKYTQAKEFLNSKETLEHAREYSLRKAVEDMAK